jgi:hypothetical protein
MGAEAGRRVDLALDGVKQCNRVFLVNSSRPRSVVRGRLRSDAEFVMALCSVPIQLASVQPLRFSRGSELQLRHRDGAQAPSLRGAVPASFFEFGAPKLGRYVALGNLSATQCPELR